MPLPSWLPSAEGISGLAAPAGNAGAANLARAIKWFQRRQITWLKGGGIQRAASRSSGVRRRSAGIPSSRLSTRAAEFTSFWLLLRKPSSRSADGVAAPLPADAALAAAAVAGCTFGGGLLRKPAVLSHWHGAAAAVQAISVERAPHSESL